MVKICHDKLLQPHSVLHYDDNKMFYYVSCEFLVKRNEEEIFKCLGYTRGLTVRNQTMFVGQSESRQLPVFLNKHTNILLDCRIYIHLYKTFIFYPTFRRYLWNTGYLNTVKSYFSVYHFLHPILVDFFLPSRIIQACFCKNRIESKKDQFAEESDIYGSNYL